MPPPLRPATGVLQLQRGQIITAPATLCRQDAPLDNRTQQELTAAGAEGYGHVLARAGDVANFLKALGHDGRLTILLHLRSGPKSVTELENLLSCRQAVVSQQLARLRLEGLVSARREGQAIFYSLLDPKVGEMLELLERLFGKPL